jgi:hypothetical protein
MQSSYNHADFQSEPQSNVRLQRYEQKMSGKKLTDVAQRRDMKIVGLLKTIYGE